MKNDKADEKEFVAELIKEETFFSDPREKTELNVTEADPLYSSAYLSGKEEEDDGYNENSTAFD